MKDVTKNKQATRQSSESEMTKASKQNLRPAMQRYASWMSSPHPQVKINWLSYKERRVDALALRADERRDKLRKASGRSKYP